MYLPTIYSLKKQFLLSVCSTSRDYLNIKKRKDMSLLQVLTFYILLYLQMIDKCNGTEECIDHICFEKDYSNLVKSNETLDVAMDFIVVKVLDVNDYDCTVTVAFEMGK